MTEEPAPGVAALIEIITAAEAGERPIDVIGPRERAELERRAARECRDDHEATAWALFARELWEVAIVRCGFDVPTIDNAADEAAPPF